MQIGELFILLGFKVDDKSLKNFDQGIKNLTQGFDLAKVAALGLGAAIGYAAGQVIKESVDAGVSLQNFQQQTGDSLEELQKWQAALRQANPALNDDQIIASIEGIEQKFVDLRRHGSGNGSIFRYFDIDPTQVSNAFDFLKKIREHINYYDRPTAVNLLQTFGIPPGFINLLTSSEKDFTHFMDVITRSNSTIGTLNELGGAIGRLDYELKVLKDDFVGGIAPGLEAMILVLEKLGHSLSIFAKASGFNFSDFAKSIGIWAAVVVAFLNPVAAVLLAITGLLSDLYSYKHGEDSLIGRIFGKDKPKAIKDQINDYLNFQPAGVGASNSNRTVHQNNTFNFPPGNIESGSEVAVRTAGNLLKGAEALDQQDLNHSLTDQQPKGSGY